jgi:hypothetical protein
MKDVPRIDWIELLAEKVHQDHIHRLDVPTDLVEPRPFKRRPRPKTAIIALAAQELIARKPSC